MVNDIGYDKSREKSSPQPLLMVMILSILHNSISLFLFSSAPFASLCGFLRLGESLNATR